MTLEGKKVALRTDLNLPLKDGEPEKTLRFNRYVETIEKLSNEGAKLTLLAHQGRPGREDFKSLKKHVALLEDELEQDIYFVESILGSELSDTLEEISEGDIILLENVRFMSEELKNLKPEKHAEGIYVNKIAQNFDHYINDAFSVSHRSHASIVGFPKILESSKGPIMKQETRQCQKVIEEFDSGVLVLGGQKPSDLIDIIKTNIESVEKVLLGGIPGELALIIKGKDLGPKEKWIREKNLDSAEEELAELISKHGDKFETPVDLKTETGTKSVKQDIQEITWDIGSETAEKYSEIIQNADSVLVKGPMGAYEEYPEGSRMIIEAVSSCDGFTVLGGGHTSSLVNRYGYSLDDFNHVSIAGGAFVKYVSGQSLPGIEALK